jgi:CRISPR system Cascade subunit CasB
MQHEGNSDRLEDAVFRLASAVVKLQPGPLARLRRMEHEGPGEGDFWQLAVEHNLRAETTYLALVRLLALLTPKGGPGGKRLHDRGTAFGAALASSNYPERRLLRFLSLPREKRADALETMVRWLAAKGHDGVNCADLYQLLLSPDVKHDRRLAHTYFTMKNKLENKDKA